MRAFSALVLVCALLAVALPAAAQIRQFNTDAFAEIYKAKADPGPAVAVRVEVFQAIRAQIVTAIVLCYRR